MMGKPKPYTLKTLADLAPAPDNPREITDEALEGLQTSIGEFGDLSKITLNSRCNYGCKGACKGHLVAGHQRVKALELKYGLLAIKDNTITTPTGETFPVRVVVWDLQTEKAANISANNPNLAGTFIQELLVGALDELRPDLPMFGELRLKELQPVELESKKEIDLGEIDAQYQIIITCESENHQKQVYADLDKKGLSCRVLTL